MFHSGQRASRTQKRLLHQESKLELRSNNDFTCIRIHFIRVHCMLFSKTKQVNIDIDTLNLVLYFHNLFIVDIRFHRKVQQAHAIWSRRSKQWNRTCTRVRTSTKRQPRSGWRHRVKQRDRAENITRTNYWNGSQRSEGWDDGLEKSDGY